jgi:protein-disulfide isomerase
MKWVLGGVALVAVLVVGWNVFTGLSDRTARSLVDLEYDSPQELLELAQPAAKGDADAPLIIMDFSDYSCPSCRAFTTQVKPFLERGYVDTGLARFAYYDFPLSGFPNSFTAARAARCAGDQDAYWEYHDQLFLAQAEWSGMADPVSTFERYARDLGLDRGEFRSCLRSDRHAEVVTANQRLGLQLGVGGTPTIFLNTREGRAARLEDWGNMEAVRGTLDAALERLGHAAPGAGEADNGELDDPEDGA